MRAVIQRVSRASVTVESQVCGRIGSGLVVFLAVEETDGEGVETVRVELDLSESPAAPGQI